MKFFKSFLSSLSTLDSMTHKTSLNQTCYVKNIVTTHIRSNTGQIQTWLGSTNFNIFYSLLVNILRENGSVKSVYQLISAQTDFLSNHSQKDETNVYAQCENFRIILPLGWIKALKNCKHSLKLQKATKIV